MKTVRSANLRELHQPCFSFNLQLPASNSAGIFKIFIAITLFIATQPLSAYACAVCFGNKNSLQTKGAMAGVFFLLVVILTVLVGLAMTFIRWGLRERAIQESFGPASSEPGHS